MDESISPHVTESGWLLFLVPLRPEIVHTFTLQAWSGTLEEHQLLPKLIGGGGHNYSRLAEFPTFQNSRMGYKDMVSRNVHKCMASSGAQSAKHDS